MYPFSHIRNPASASIYCIFLWLIIIGVLFIQRKLLTLNLLHCSFVHVLATSNWRPIMYDVPPKLMRASNLTTLWLISTTLGNIRAKRIFAVALQQHYTNTLYLPTQSEIQRKNSKDLRQRLVAERAFRARS